MKEKRIDMNNISKVKKIISIILVVLWMITVFYFSSEIGDDSSQTSGNTIRKIITFINKNMSEQKLEEIIELLQPFVRKLAHFTLYTIGGILIYNIMNQTNNSNKNKIIKSQLLGSIYAITDELHQYFVPGRSCRLFDVFIDSCGIFTGIIIYILILKMIFIVKKKSHKEKY
jgi:hypothetical protein